MRFGIGAKLLLALLLWGAAIVPHVVPWPQTADDWNWFIPVSYRDDDLYYFAQINQSRTESRIPGNTYLKEHAGDAPFQHAYYQYFLSRIISPFGGHYRLSYFWLALLFYLGFVFFAGGLLQETSKLPELQAFGVLLLGVSCLGEGFPRIIHPKAACYPLLLAGYWALWRLWHDEHPSWGWIFLAVASAGCLDYSYPFYAIFMNLCFGAVVFLRICQKNRAIGTMRLALGLTAAFLCSLPFLWDVFIPRSAATASEIFTQNGFLHSHWPSPLGGSILVVAFALVWLLLPRRVASFLLIGLAVGFVCLEQHIVTGFYFPMVTHHFGPAYRLPLALSVVSIFQHKLPLRVLRHGAWAVFALLLGFWFIQTRAAFSKLRSQQIEEAESYRPALSWLMKNANNCVVVSSIPSASMVVAFTSCRSFIGAYAYISTTPQSELTERAFSVARIYGLNREGFLRYCQSQPLPFWGYSLESRLNRELIINRFRRWLKLPAVDVETERRAASEAMADQYLAGIPNKPWEIYEADYVIQGPWEDLYFPDFKSSQHSDLTEVYRDERVRLWAIRKAKTNEK